LPPFVPPFLPSFDRCRRKASCSSILDYARTDLASVSTPSRCAIALSLIVRNLGAPGKASRGAAMGALPGHCM
jgi:hypothetical protein